MFASEWIDGGVNPDILICPISVIATRNELSIKQNPKKQIGLLILLKDNEKNKWMK
jgi:hypothetical protein